MYYVYLVTNKHNSVLYVGVTSNLEGRIFEHRERLIEGFTKRYQVTKLIFYEDYPDPRSAIAREKQLKGWRREKKIALIEKQNPRWCDLFDELTAGFDVDLLNREKQEPLIVRDPSTAPRQARLAQDDRLF
ncbi:MAG: GIY-YIG nuclease family protein [Methylacidiphilales bacterium]|nr:GIY-YIG nuclease family protein [Candidatus Methylacidiphilales bacterium]